MNFSVLQAVIHQIRLCFEIHFLSPVILVVVLPPLLLLPISFVFLVVGCPFLLFFFSLATMFLEGVIYQQSAFFCMVCSVVVSLFLIASHLAYAFHTDIKTVPFLLLPRIRQILFPLSSSSSSLSRWLAYPHYQSHFSAPPLQPPLHVCRIVMLVPVYAITSYLAFRYAEPSPSSSFVRFSFFSSVGPGHYAYVSPSLSPRQFSPRQLYGVKGDEDPKLSQSKGVEPRPPLFSWSTRKTETGGTGLLQQQQQHQQKGHYDWGVHTPPLPSAVDQDRGREGSIESISSSVGGVIEEKLGVDFESLGKGTGGCLGFTLHAVRDMYEVYVLYSFIALLVAVLGGEEEAVQQLHLKVCTPHSLLACVVFPLWILSR